MYISITDTRKKTYQIVALQIVYLCPNDSEPSQTYISLSGGQSILSNEGIDSIKEKISSVVAH